MEERNVIRTIVAEFFDKMALPVTFKDEITEGEVLNINLESDSPQILIGENGRTLAELQHILRLVVAKKLGQPAYFNLDINDYRKKKDTYLRELAEITANEVSLMQKEKELLPMTAQERRVIHVTLADRSDIVTESRGEEPERKVVIKPAAKTTVPSELP